MTAAGWLNLYLQVSSLKESPKLLLPQYSQEKFIQIAQVSTGVQWLFSHIEIYEGQYVDTVCLQVKALGLFSALPNELDQVYGMLVPGQ